MKQCYKLKFIGPFLTVILSCFTLHAQTISSLITDNKLKTSLDSTIDYAAKIYLQDDNTNGISLAVYYKSGKYINNYGKADKGKLKTIKKSIIPLSPGSLVTQRTLRPSVVSVIKKTGRKALKGNTSIYDYIRSHSKITCPLNELVQNQSIKYKS